MAKYPLGSLHSLHFFFTLFTTVPTKEPGPRIVEPLRVGCNRLGAGSLFGM